MGCHDNEDLGRYNVDPDLFKDKSFKDLEDMFNCSVQPDKPKHQPKPWDRINMPGKVTKQNQRHGRKRK